MQNNCAGGAAAPICWTVVGVPTSRRLAGFRDAVEQHAGHQVRLISYADLLGDALPPAPPHGSLVRLESPGEDDEVTKHLLRLGIEPMRAAGRVPTDAAAIGRIVFARGEVLHPRQWFLGFQAFLQRLARDWSGLGLRWMSTPDAILTAFDKLRCLRLWESAGLPTPRRWDGIQTYHQLRAAINERHARVFVKLRYGYSAMGAVALEWRGERVRAITTVETVWNDGRPRLFVTKRPRVLLREQEIAWLIDTLAMEEVIVEQWLPKARWRGLPFDVRIVCIGQQARHVVGRGSTSPFTNLNLDATRIAASDLAVRLGASWQTLRELAARAAASIPDAFALGLDLLVRPGEGHFALLEANAFGDYLPRLTDGGQTTYEAEVTAFLACDTVASEQQVRA